MFVVLGATGNTGKVVADTLLNEKKQVRLFVRDPKKVAEFAKRGAEVLAGDIEDVPALTSALKGAEGAFFLLPPPAMTATGVIASRAKLADALVAAVRGSGIKGIVLLSSIGAQHAEGTGIIQTIHYLESHLRQLGINATFLHCAYFLENWLGMLHPVKTDGVLPAFFSPAKKIPMVATRDIGITAAHALLDNAKHTGNRVIELSGPEDYSTEDVAAVFGKLLNKEVSVFPVPRKARVGAMEQAGIGSELAALFVGMYTGIDDGKVSFEGHDATRAYGKITLEAFLTDAL